jgi:hypothetical protein
MSDKELIPLNLSASYRTTPQAKHKPTPVGRMRLADSHAFEVFATISNAFVVIAGRPLRALHLESKTEMDKGSFVNWCLRYGDLRLDDDHGTVAAYPAGLYWWECQLYLEPRRVVTRASLTAKANLYRPPREDSI